jgi:flagellar hook-basal body complex protein FliE
LKTRRVARLVLNQVEEKQEQLVSTKERQEITDIIEFESVLKERIEDLNVKLKNSNNLLESVLGRLSDLKYGDIARAIEIAEANKNLKQAKSLREELCDIHDIESEMSAKMQRQKVVSANIVDEMCISGDSLST